MSGYLYIIKYGDFHKIGITNDLNDRLSNIQSGFPSRIDVEACFSFDNPLSVEKEIHAKFDLKRASGEWFSLEPEDIYQIRKMCLEIGGVEIRVKFHEKRLDRSKFKNEQEKKQDELDNLEFILNRLAERGFRVGVFTGYNDSAVVIVEGASLDIHIVDEKFHFSVGKMPETRPQIAFIYPPNESSFWELYIDGIKRDMANVKRTIGNIFSRQA